MLDSPVGGECKLIDMPSSLAIGDFSRATRLTVKMLRHYHKAGLLEPAHIDPQTGYRRYTTDQVPVAQIIRRFRDLDKPLNEIRAVLSAPELQTRNDLIAGHLKRLEHDLARTQTAVASLWNLLEPAAAAEIGRRKADQVTAAAIGDVVDVKDLLSWYLGAVCELHAARRAGRRTRHPRTRGLARQHRPCLQFIGNVCHGACVGR
jgi:DNA-binding transcriptional MerR regulator